MSRVVVLTGAVALALVVRPGAPAAEHAPTVRVAFLQGEQLVQVRRPGRAPADAIRRLLAGLTHAEKARSFRTYVPAGTRLRRLTIQRGLATVDLTARFLSKRSDEHLLASVSQVVKTLSSFSRVARVRLLVAGKPVARVVNGVQLASPITMRYHQTPNVPVPKPPPARRRPPDAVTLRAQKRLMALGYLVAATPTAGSARPRARAPWHSRRSKGSTARACSTPPRSGRCRTLPARHRSRTVGRAGAPKSSSTDR